MDIAMANARDFAECACINLLLDKTMRGLTPHKEACLENDSSFFDSVCHAISISGFHAKWFLDKQMFPGGCCQFNQTFMLIGFRTNHNCFNLTVTQNVR